MGEWKMEMGRLKRLCSFHDLQILGEAHFFCNGLQSSRRGAWSYGRRRWMSFLLSTEGVVDGRGGRFFCFFFLAFKGSSS